MHCGSPKYFNRPRKKGLYRRVEIGAITAGHDPYAVDPVNADRLYTDEEREFLMACDRYREAGGKRFLRAADYLTVLLSLGYRRPTKE